MQCKCGSENVTATGADNVRHAIKDGAVVHVIEDAHLCEACGSVFNLERFAAEQAGPDQTAAEEALAAPVDETVSASGWPAQDIV